MATGVYSITCIATGEQYVGSTSQGFARRRAEHWSKLRKGQHHSPALQLIWNLYGEEGILFAVVEECEPEHAVLCEQYWIDTLHPSLNIQPLAMSPRGRRMNPVAMAALVAYHTGRKRTEESRRRQSESLKVYWASDERRAEARARKLGSHHSDEEKAKMSAGGLAHRARLRAENDGCAATPETRQKMSESARRKWDRVGLKTHCIHGHAYTEENTYKSPGGVRMCRACMRESEKRRALRRRRDRS